MKKILYLFSFIFLCCSGNLIAQAVGDCGVANGTPGCSDPACEAAICAIDSFCCDIAWDQICADLANDNAGMGLACSAAPMPPPVLCPPIVAYTQAPDQMGHGGGGTVGATSDAAGPFAVADNYTPGANETINAVSWWGFYVDFSAGPSDCGPGTGDNFSITYYTDAAGLPGGIYAGPFAVLVSKAATGATIPTGIGPIAEYGYSATHPDVPLIGGTTYWVEVQETNPGSCFWLWETAPPGDGGAAQDNGGYAPTDYDVAFCLSSPDPSAQVVPTMGEWGMIFLVLFTLTLGVLFVPVRKQTLAGTYGNISVGSKLKIPFNGSIYGRFLLATFGLVALGFAIAILAFGYSLTNADIPGALITSPVLAYLLYLVLGKRE